MWLLLSPSLAFAAHVRATLWIDARGATVVDAILLPGDVRAGAAGPLEVRGADGTVLASAALPDARTRSIIAPDGDHGEQVAVASGLVRAVVPWPEGAAWLSLDGERQIDPHVPAPAPGDKSLVVVQESGPSTERLDLVFLAEGYTDAEQEQFADDVDRMVAKLLATEPYGAYTDLFNIWRIDTVSAQSGADKPQSGIAVDTAYGCFYNCAGIDRLLCCDDSAVMGAVNTLVPDADGVMVLVNDTKYGGAGGFNYATSYTNGDDSEEVAVHELGHSLVGLADEYNYGTPAPGGWSRVNCSSSPTGDDWAVWHGVDGVSAFPTCSYNGFHRPTDLGCIMNVLAADAYCPICREAAVHAIYGALPRLLVAPSVDFGSPVALADGATTTVEVEVLGPDDGASSVTWEVDGVVVGDGRAIALDCADAGTTLTVKAADTTAWVRRDPLALLVDEASWPLDTSACSGVGDDTGPDADDTADGDGDGPPCCKPLAEGGCACSHGHGEHSPIGLAILAGFATLRRRRA